jgi:hypothetical protein
MRKQIRLLRAAAASSFIALGALPASAQIRAQSGAVYGRAALAVPAIGVGLLPSAALSSQLAPLGLNSACAAPSSLPFVVSAAPAAASAVPPALAAIAAAAAPENAEVLRPPAPEAAAKDALVPTENAAAAEVAALGSPDQISFDGASPRTKSPIGAAMRLGDGTVIEGRNASHSDDPVGSARLHPTMARLRKGAASLSPQDINVRKNEASPDGTDRVIIGVVAMNGSKFRFVYRNEVFNGARIVAYSLIEAVYPLPIQVSLIEIGGQTAFGFESVLEETSHNPELEAEAVLLFKEILSKIP